MHKVTTLNRINSHIAYIGKMLRPSGLNKLVLETSSNCNYQCSFCWTTKTDNVRENMSVEVFNRTMEQAKDLNIKEVSLSYGGEPLLNPDIFEMIERIKKCGYYCYMPSNGALLTSEISEKIIDSGIDKVEFSFHANCRQTYEKVFGQDNCEKVIENIKYLVEKRGEKQKPEIMINYYVMDLNIDEYLTEHPLDGVVDGINYWAIVDVPTGIEKHSVIKNACRLTPCHWLLSQINVLSNGDISLGCFIDGGHRLKIGNVFEDTIQKAFTSKRTRRIIRSFFFIGISKKARKNIVQKYPMCANCFDNYEIERNGCRCKV